MYTGTIVSLSLCLINSNKTLKCSVLIKFFGLNLQKGILTNFYLWGDTAKKNMINRPKLCNIALIIKKK